MNHLDVLPVRRTTNDIDFSIYIHKYDDFNKLKEYMVAQEGFSKMMSLTVCTPLMVL